MGKLWIPKIIIFCLSCLLVVGFFYPYAKPLPKGIYLDDSQNKIMIDVNSTQFPSLFIQFPEDYICSSASFVKDSILPKGQKGVIEETSVQMELWLPQISLPVSANTIIRTFRNGDLFILVRFFSTQTIPQPIQFTFNSAITESQSAQTWYLQYTSDKRPEEATVILPPSLHYMEFINDQLLQGSILAGAPSVYEKAPTEHSDISTLVRMNSQPVVQWDQKTGVSITSSISLESYQTAECWFFASKRSMLDFTNEETVQNMRSADFTLRKKITKDGIFHIANEHQYVGASNDRFDYYYTFAGWEGRRFMNLHQKYPEQSFFYDMFANTVYTIAKAASKYGSWPSGHASVYLWNLYHFPKNFIDTRYGTDAGFFLLKAYNDYQIPEALYTGKKFGDYLVELSQKDQKIKTENGFFFYDYYHKDFPNTVTHASLNHILSEMNYLLDLYLATHDDSYLATAEKVLAAIQDTEKRWIRKDATDNYRWYHDLWYCVIPKSDGSLFFENHDYTKDLTYKDLLKSQYLIEKIYNRKNSSIENLIQHKKEFLLKAGFDLDQIHSDFTLNQSR